MTTIFQTDTIVAVATPPGTGAIGVVRVSGPAAMPLLVKVWRNKQSNVDNYVNRRIYFGNIFDFSTGGEGVVVDEVLVATFFAPHTYTGEDVVEVYGHGNPYILERIVEQFVRVGARLAQPGEFTQRAYLNGRIDLTQAEAVADLIAATSAQAHRCATEQLQGRLSRVIRQQLDALTGVRIFVEATIDFPEEDIEMISHARIDGRLQEILHTLQGLSATYQEGRLYREGARVVLAGLPNAGKSSLLNALLGEERAIVHPYPGTTRDVIEEIVRIDGVAFRLVDTAGLRGPEAEEVERIGIERTRQQLNFADLLLVVVDASRPFRGSEREFLSERHTGRLIITLNKADLPLQTTEADLRTVFPQAPVILLSATRGDGLDELRAAISVVARSGSPKENEGVLVTNARHKAALEEAIHATECAVTALAATRLAELVAEHLRVASEALGRVVGTVTTDELLGQIFSQFCIGK